jgi:hypothetical protein
MGIGIAPLADTGTKWRDGEGVFVMKCRPMGIIRGWDSACGRNHRKAPERGDILPIVGTYDVQGF